MTPGEDLSREAAPAAFSGGVAPPETGPSADAFEPPLDPAAAPPERSLAEDLRDLAGDAQTLFEAEKAYESARLSYAVSRGKKVAVAFVVAGVLGYFALVAAVVGLVLALTPLMTAWVAMAVVTFALALVAFLFFRSAMKQLQRMRTFLGLGAASAAATGATS